MLYNSNSESGDNMRKFIELVKNPTTGLKMVYEHLVIETVFYDQVLKKATVVLSNPSPLEFKTYLNVKSVFERKLTVPFDITIKCNDKTISDKDIQSYFYHFFDFNQIYAPYKTSSLVIQDGHIEVLMDEPDNTFLEHLRIYFKQLGITYTISTKAFEVSEIISLEIPKMTVQMQQTPSKTVNKPKYANKGFTAIKLSDIQEYENANVKFEAKIIEVTTTDTKSGKIFVLLCTDEYEGVYIKFFARGEEEEEYQKSLKVGSWYEFNGMYQFDNFSKKMIVLGRKFQPITKTDKVDDAFEKRVELHLHTKMSEMDGVSDVQDVIEYVYNLGHDGVAITDHADVQAFVKAHQKAKQVVKKGDRPFKVLYGCEMNLVDEFLNIIKKPQDRNLVTDTYVVFDIETTGLSNFYNEVIEFAGVKVENGQVVDKCQMFIKPSQPIPMNIQKLTNIHDEDVKDAPSFQEAIEIILEWIADATLVAHNASFDYDFLNAQLEKYGKSPLNNPIIDTLDLVRYLKPEKKSYRLGAVAKMYNIEYFADDAHRADYDTDVLVSIFLKIIHELEKENIHNQMQLAQMHRFDDYVKLFSHHISVLVKNQEGMSDLYELVTTSCTETLVQAKSNHGASEARIFKRHLAEKREHLLIGSACLNGEVFEVACNKSQKDLEEVMAFYDYIEVQPLGHYHYLIAKGNIQDVEQLKSVLRRIIETAVSLNKIIVATGDVHYLRPYEKRARDVLIHNKGVGGVAHPLFLYDEHLRRTTQAPDQHFLTTQEMLQSFEWLDDEVLVQKIVVENTRKIFDMIEAVQPVPDGTYPPEIEGCADKLKAVCYQTAHEKYGEVLPQIVEERLKTELESILGAGYEVIYYVSHLLVKQSNEDGYVVGSRGSVGSSFVATMSKITEVNPLPPHYVCDHCCYTEFVPEGSVATGFDLKDKPCPKCGQLIRGDGHNIPFETFLGFKGDKVPDIDLNFSDEYQPHAHAFTRTIFGEDHVFRAGTISTVAEKTAYGNVKAYLESVHNTTMTPATIDYLSRLVTGVKKTTGQHPGGIIIFPKNKKVSTFTPIQYPANESTAAWKTTHFDFHDIHDNVLKMDILGHVDPTAIKMLESLSKVDVTKIPLNDEKTLSIFSSIDALEADTRVYDESTGAVGLPEFGTRTTRGILNETKPTTFGELAIISGLSHGENVWANNAQELVKNGMPISEVIGCRDDIMTYLIQKKLPKSDAFKIMESVRKGKGVTPEWEALMKEHNVPEWYIESCKKIKYMFPKAHATAYVIMAVRIAWFKVHMPQYFYATYFTHRVSNYEIQSMASDILTIKNRMNEIKLKDQEARQHGKRLEPKLSSIYDCLEVCLECYARGYRISPVSLTKSDAFSFLVDEDNKTLIPPFKVVEGLGPAVAKEIIKARDEAPFRSIEDLARRGKVSKSIIEVFKIMGVTKELAEKDQFSLF